MRKQVKTIYRFCTNLIDSPFVILIYHRVTNLSIDPQLLSVSPENFDAQLDHLRKNYNILNISQFTELMTSGKKPGKNSVVITFDDGYADNLLEAIPILEKHDSQALFYITTSKLSTSSEFWWDELERIFLIAAQLPATLHLEIPGQQDFSTGTPESRRTTYDSLHPVIKNLAPERRDSLMNEIIEWSGQGREGRPSHRILTHEELIKLSQSSAAVVGAHTHNHPKLSVCTEEAQEFEMNHSKNILEGITGRGIDHFSYPFGSKDDYGKATISICKRLGFSVVCANNQGPVHSWHSRYALPRMLVRNWEVKEFENSLRSFFHY